MGIDILSTGGTAALLRENGVDVTEVADVTGFPEIMDGRVKTLHPKIHGGILALRDKAEHRAQMEELGIDAIDMVVVNLYPFEATVAREAPFDEIIEQIDIGGPAMIRSAAKNHPHVAVVVEPSDYALVADELLAGDGELSGETRFRLACQAFHHTARYDGAISNYLGRLDGERKAGAWGEKLNLQLSKLQELRYGENPHQSAAFYAHGDSAGPSVARATQVQGKQLSFNNILDADAALSTVLDFSETAAVAIKHTNPCGLATSDVSLADAFRKAKAGDPVSIFGGVIALNRPVDAETANELKQIFLEIVIAPSFTPEAREILVLGQAAPQHPPAGDRHDPGNGRHPRPAPGPRRRAGAGLGPQTHRRSGMQGGDRAAAHRRRVQGPGVCLAGVPPRQIQCHRVHLDRPVARRRRRPDEPGGFRQPRGHPRQDPWIEP